MLLSFRLSPLPPVVSLQSRQCQRRQLWSRGHFEISVGAPQFLFSGMSNLNPVAGGGSSDDCPHDLCLSATYVVRLLCL
eukprot:m.222129 g.222129  ORF g.222129 m.222129 type:complete len:79 (+) comp54172_c1_seq16:135-371(+)